MSRMRATGKPPNTFKTHAIRSPLATHYRQATCKEIQCDGHVNGWMFVKESLSPEELYLATKSGRRYREVQISPGVTHLIYEAGQTCFEFSSHFVPLERPELYFVGRGDQRMFNPRQATQHTNPDDFIDDWANHLDKIAQRIMRG